MSEHEFKKQVLSNIELIGKNLKDPKKKTLLLDVKEQYKVVSRMKPFRFALITWIMIETGVRVGDVFRLKRDAIEYNVYTEKKRVPHPTIKGKSVLKAGKSMQVMRLTFVQKGDKRNVVTVFNPGLIRQIQKYLRGVFIDLEYLFLDRSIVPDPEKREDIPWCIKLNYERFRLRLKEAVESLGYDASKFTSHDIRRNFCSRVWEDVVEKRDIEVLRRIMNHSSIQTTIQYLRHSGMDTQDAYHKLYTVESGTR